MPIFRVWAPNADKVELKLGDRHVPMHMQSGGWWEIDAPDAQIGTDYGYVLDGEGPFPDPRSPWQPNGVYGLSRTVDHAAFPWTDKDWESGPLSAAVIYELHIGTFTPEGTFDAAISKLDYLKELGITHIEIMPVNEFPGTHGWGYDGVDLYAPHHVYGGPEGLRRLVNACHKKELSVILDVVYNHLGPSGNYLGRFGPYFTDRYHTPWGEAVNLDGPDSDEVRRFFIDNALMWLRDYHMDGLRIDAVHAIIDMSAVHFLEALAEEIAELETRLGRNLVLIAESNLNDPRVVRRRDIGGYGIHAQWLDDFHHALHCVLTGEKDGYYVDFGSLTHLAKSLQKAFVYDGDYSPFRKRRHGRPATGLPGHRFITFLQNHDQIGNRAKGERSSHLMNINLLQIGSGLLFTSPFVPMLFQGEEWGASSPFIYFTDHDDPLLAEAVREGRRNEFADFGWEPEDIPDPQALETFERCKLKWDELEQEPCASLLEWHRRLIQLRRTHASLANGRLDLVEIVFDEKEKWLEMTRDEIFVLCNLSDKRLQIPIPKATRNEILLMSREIYIDKTWFDLPPESMIIAIVR